MAKKLPKIYQADFSHKIENNEKVFYSKKNNEKEDNVVVSQKLNSSSNVSIEEELNSLFNTTGYIFNIPLEIKTATKTLNTNIAGKVKNTLITLDNDVIPISTIISIKRKDRI